LIPGRFGPIPQMNDIQREILGIFLFFLVLFSLVSLLSFDPADPSVFTDAGGPAENLFGLMGAHVSGLILGLFGTGGFWTPFVLLMVCYQSFRRRGRDEMLALGGGAALLLIATGAFMALWRSQYPLFGSDVPAGGLIGAAVREATLRYAGPVGAALGLFLLIVVGFLLATGLSLVDTARWAGEQLAGLGKAAGRRGAALLRVGLDRSGTAFGQGWRDLRAGFEARLSHARDHRRKRKAIPVKPDPLQSLPSPESAKPEPAPAESAPRTPAKKRPSPKIRKKDDRQIELPLSGPETEGLPSIDFLENPKARPPSVDRSYLNEQGRLLEAKLEDFGVKGEVTNVIPGPVITTFEYKPASGVKINKIVNLTDDLALALRALSIRIVAPIPGRSVIGIEIPNAVRETVRFKEVCATDDFQNSASPLSICMGKDIEGKPVVAQLDRMPHLLIAGATGTGKSVFLNSLICSFLYKANPEDVKLIMIDPKRIELSAYDGIPHLITPVVTDVKKATNALYWAVREMERRYELLSELRVRNINQFNRKAESGARRPTDDGEEGELLEPLPYVVVIIDELADLMMVASRDVEVALMRLAQMARAAGIHLILATQRPSVDVLTGVIKANFPTRLTFQVSSKTDSRTVIDTNGAEKLLGNGDMLFLPPGTARLSRIHGSYISEEELGRITDFLKRQGVPEYDEAVVEAPSGGGESEEEMDVDERYDDAVALVTRTRQASISMVQRHLRIGYNRAARIIEMMEREGVVGPADGAKAREVLVAGYDDMAS
jgi:S-DNA-T family DNA segregation ATPase FtsK/SpoIIIE